MTSVVVVAGLLTLVVMAIGFRVWANRRQGRPSEVAPTAADLVRSREVLRGLFRDLSSADRWRVRWAVWRGRAVTDRNLAAAAVAKAHLVSETKQFEQRRGWLHIAGPVVLMLSVILRLTSSDYSGRLRGLDLTLLILFTALILHNLFGLGYFLRRSARAERLNSDLLGKS